VSCVRSSLTLFDGALATDRNFRAGLGFHLLEGVSTRSNE
jgi:hypothetical protein